jgi:integrase
MPQSPGRRHGRIVSFLLSALQPVTQLRYQRALDAFSSDLEQVGIDAGALSEEELDVLLAERVVDLFEESGGSEGLGSAATLLASFSKAHPRHHYRTAWKALDVWRQRRPPQQAPAVPAVLGLGMVNWLLLAGQPHCAAAVLLCFTGLLRASEALRLDSSMVFRTPEGWVLVLGQTKRGLEQKVLLCEPSTIKWIDAYVSHCGSLLSARFCPVSYTTLQRWLQRSADSLGFGAVHWTSHGLRRGGASELLRRGVPLSDIMLFGRWLSERSAREYLRRGEVSLTRLRVDIASSAWMEAARFCSFGAASWDAFSVSKF